MYSTFSLLYLAKRAARLAAIPQAIDLAAFHALDARADSALAHLRGATNVESGATQGAWRKVILGTGAIAVINDRVAARGFVVAAGLITGTGQRARATPGYGGSFGAMLGMQPSQTLRPAWDRETSTPLSIGSILGGGLL